MSSDWDSWFYSSGTGGGGGNPPVRSSLESNRSDVHSGDDEVVEPDQGNGIYYSISILS